MPPEDLIVLEGVSKDYVSGAGVVRALRELDLVIRAGDFVAIVGASGSGKSTLMNILGCLDRPTRGKYVLAGVEVGSRENDARAIVRNRLIGFVFQGFNLLPRTTAQENVELPLQYRGVGVRERRRRAQAALEAVGLTGRMHHTPSALSGGQQQRVAIARALVTDPPLLLADEPTGNLDTRTSLEVLALLQRLNKDLGITIVLVTHEHDIAACASRVATFRDGRMVSDIRNEKPLAALEALEQLPTDGRDANATDDIDTIEDPTGGPVPWQVFAWMVAGTALGQLVGSLYGTVILGQRVSAIAMAFAFLAEAWLATRAARTHLHRPMARDQRARVALFYTLGTSTVIGAGFLLAISMVPFSLVRSLQGMSVPLLILGIAAAIATMSLLRFLLLTLFATIMRPKPKEANA